MKIKIKSSPAIPETKIKVEIMVRGNKLHGIAIKFEKPVKIKTELEKMMAYEQIRQVVTSFNGGMF